MKFKNKEQQAAVMSKYPKRKGSSSSRTTDSYDGYEGRSTKQARVVVKGLSEREKDYIIKENPYSTEARIIKQERATSRKRQQKQMRTIRKGLTKKELEFVKEQKRQNSFKPRKMHKAGDTRRISSEEPLYDNKGRRIDGKEIGIISVKGNQATAIMHGEKQTVPTAFLVPPKWFNKLSADEMKATIEYQRKS